MIYVAIATSLVQYFALLNRTNKMVNVFVYQTTMTTFDHAVTTIDKEQQIVCSCTCDTY